MAERQPRASVARSLSSGDTRRADARSSRKRGASSCAVRDVRTWVWKYSRWPWFSPLRIGWWQCFDAST